jgi:hypothetical protein
LNYELLPIGTREWAVRIEGDPESCGTIRSLSSTTWGWKDKEGLHEYQSKEDAAIACIKLAPKRRQWQIAGAMQAVGRPRGRNA